jgi:hypothetical protein
MVKWNAFLSGLCGLALVLGSVAGSAYADVTTEKGASILIFPRVVSNGRFDTVIQIANTGNSPVLAQCFYVNGALHSTLTGAPCTIPSAACTPLCQETDFIISLTKQQPTHWLVSTGRRVDLRAGFGTDGAGFPPGLIPPVVDFEGELKCVEITESGSPITGNHLKGEATIKVVDDVAAGDVVGDVSKYNAVGILGNPDVQPANPLLLDGHNYEPCPAKLILNNFSTLPGTRSTELTLVPCSEDFENQVASQVTVQFLVTNEFEEQFSASTTVNCYLSTELTNIDAVFSERFLGTPVAQTEITPIVNNGGVVGVAELRVIEEGAAARAAYNLHTQGDLIPASGADQIRLTGE